LLQRTRYRDVHECERKHFSRYGDDHRNGSCDWALAKARKTLKEHQPDMLDERLSQELERIIKSVEK